MSGALVLAKAFGQKYGLVPSVDDPRPKEGNTKTWTIRIITRPGSKSEKQQRIDLDVCTLTADKLCDSAWLRQKPANRIPIRVAEKLQGYGVTMQAFSRRLGDRIMDMKSEESRITFMNELIRFLPARFIKTAQRFDVLGVSCHCAKGRERFLGGICPVIGTGVAGRCEESERPIG
jgi:hypothetical protein